MALRIAGTTLLILATIGCGSSGNTTMAPTNGTPVSIVSGSSNLTTTAYSPNPITVAVGGSITWTNNDNTAHTATDDAGGWNSGSIAPGGSFSRTFPSAGTFPYHCTLHANMIGSVRVQ